MQRAETLEVANGSVNERGITGRLSVLDYSNVSIEPRFNRSLQQKRFL